MNKERYIEINEQRTTHIVARFENNGEYIEKNQFNPDRVIRWRLETNVIEGIYDYNKQEWLPKQEVDAYVQESKRGIREAINAYDNGEPPCNEYRINSKGARLSFESQLNDYVDYNPNLTIEDIPTYEENLTNVF